MKKKSLILFLPILIFIGCNKNENIIVVDNEIKSITIRVYDENDSTYNSLKIISKEKVVIYNDTVFVGLSFIYKDEVLFEGYFNWDNGQLFSLESYYEDKIPESLDKIYDDFDSDLISEITKDFDMDTSYFFNHKEPPYLPNMGISLGFIIPSNPHNGKFLSYKICEPFNWVDIIEINFTTEFKLKEIKFLYIKDKEKLRI